MPLAEGLRDGTRSCAYSPKVNRIALSNCGPVPRSHRMSHRTLRTALLGKQTGRWRWITQVDFADISIDNSTQLLIFAVGHFLCASDEKKTHSAHFPIVSQARPAAGLSIADQPPATQTAAAQRGCSRPGTKGRSLLPRFSNSNLPLARWPSQNPADPRVGRASRKFCRPHPTAPPTKLQHIRIRRPWTRTQQQRPHQSICLQRSGGLSHPRCPTPIAGQPFLRRHCHNLCPLQQSLPQNRQIRAPHCPRPI